MNCTGWRQSGTRLDSLAWYNGLKKKRFLGSWYLTHDRWDLIPDIFQLIYDSWCKNLNVDIWHLTPETWNLKPETWHQTPDIWHLRAPADHIVTFRKFHRIGGAPPETFPNVKYDAPEELDGDRKCFDSPIRKWGVVHIIDKNSSRALTLCSLTVFFCP